MTKRSDKTSILDKIFGAANSYSGFKSSFDKIFNPENYTKLFILKGGPGTGKSTLMKRIADYGKDRALEVTLVYCSSDPDSLDGVILSVGDKKIAVIDGTAPHTQDPIYPGAAEEIINLGDSFDIAKLESHRDEIITLGKDKSRYYKGAYSLLCAAGEVGKQICNNIVINEDYFKADAKISDCFALLKKEKKFKEAKQSYIASFSKHGYKKLPTDTVGKTQINLSGEPLSCYLFMNEIKKKASELSVIEELCPSPLTPEITDRIYTDTLVFTVNEGERSDISLPPIKTSELHDDIFKSLRSLLSSAVDCLARASECHFKMEKIYIGAMNFERNDLTLRELIARLDKIFV